MEAYRKLDVTVVSAADLKHGNLLSKMKVYAAVSINEDAKAVLMTHVDKSGGSNPRWNDRFTFAVKAATLERDSGLPLVFKLRTERPALSDKTIGVVRVPLMELFDSAPRSDEAECVVVKYVQNASNGTLEEGTLVFSYKLGENVAPRLNSASRRSQLSGSGGSSPEGQLSGRSSPHGRLSGGSSPQYGRLSGRSSPHELLSGGSSPQYRRLLGLSGRSSPHGHPGASRSTVYYRSPPRDPPQPQQPQQGPGLLSAGLTGIASAAVGGSISGLVNHGMGGGFS